TLRPARCVLPPRRSCAAGVAAQEVKLKRPGTPSLSRAVCANGRGFWFFGTLSFQCAARHMDISAFVPLQDLGFGRRAARLAVQSVFRNEEETRSEFLALIRQRPNGV